MTKPSYAGDGSIWVKILETRHDYPPVDGTEGRRYLAVGDITTFDEENANAYVLLGLAEFYDPRGQ